MKKANIFGGLLLLVSSILWAQNTRLEKKSEQKDSSVVQLAPHIRGEKIFRDQDLRANVYETENGDQYYMMDPMHLKGTKLFNNNLDRRYYSFLERKLYSVYPVFVEALEQYRMLRDDLRRVPEKKRRAYARERQNKLADQYEKQLRNLTTTQGRIFAKLMYRATGKTVYELIKELRGGWSAFWWNLKGNLADIELKKDYNPYLNREDKYIESLLQRGWEKGIIRPYPGYQNFKYKKTHDDK